MSTVNERFLREQWSLRADGQLFVAVPNTNGVLLQIPQKITTAQKFKSSGGEVIPIFKHHTVNGIYAFDVQFCRTRSKNLMPGLKEEIHKLQINEITIKQFGRKHTHDISAIYMPSCLVHALSGVNAMFMCHVQDG